MAPKKKQKQVASSSATYDSHRFWNEEAADIYVSLKSKSILQERGFDMTEGFNISQPDVYEIGRIVSSRQWKLFVFTPLDAVLSLVREFYANLKVRQDGFKVLVHGKLVAFDSNSINNLYMIPPVLHDEYVDYKNNAIDFSIIIQCLCREGADWRLDRNGFPSAFKKSDLDDDAKSWYSFVCARLKPTEHSNTVTKERAILVYCLLTGKQMDLGKICQDTIMKVVTVGTTSGLSLPALITDLCASAGVTWDASEELLKPKYDIVVVEHRPILPEYVKRSRAARQEFSDRAAARRPPQHCSDILLGPCRVFGLLLL